MDTMSHALHGSAPLPHLGVIRVEGEDAARFLHGQLTQDFLLLPDGQARLTALCSPKGRMLASFIGVKLSSAEILLVCPQDMLAAMVRRLSMYVLRAKVRLSDATAQWALRGLLGPSVAEVAASSGPAWSAVQQGDARVVFLYPADDTPMALWLAPAGVPLPTQPEVPADRWRWAEVRSGVAWVGAAVTEAYVPQMLNYESIDGVHFKKGCYPGQEVVARSQFRGTLKRRAVLAHAETPLSAGDALFAPEDPDQPAASVVQAAQAPGGGWDAIVSGQISAFGGAPLALGAAGGPAVQVAPAPYPLRDDI
jgi:hypothetical protein